MVSWLGDWSWMNCKTWARLLDNKFLYCGQNNSICFQLDLQFFIIGQADKSIFEITRAYEAQTFNLHRPLFHAESSERMKTKKEARLCNLPFINWLCLIFVVSNGNCAEFKLLRGSTCFPIRLYAYSSRVQESKWLKWWYICSYINYFPRRFESRLDEYMYILLIVSVIINALISGRCAHHLLNIIFPLTIITFLHIAYSMDHSTCSDHPLCEQSRKDGQLDCFKTSTKMYCPSSCGRCQHEGEGHGHCQDSGVQTWHSLINRQQ